MLDLFRDGFCICGGPFGSGMWKNWKVAALKYFRPVTYMACGTELKKISIADMAAGDPRKADFSAFAFFSIFP